ncbi:MAG: serine hydrolase domain-containing protein [Actinomycetota bacterium]
MREVKLPDGVEGYCDERFAPVADVLAKQLASDEHHGVAFAARFRGEPVVDLWGGKRNTPDGEAPWQRDTMTICFSTTKGVAATALHMAMERAGLSYDTPVAKVWPEFGASGKDTITIAHLLTHQAGVPQIREEIDSSDDLADWDAMVRVMEGLTPMWEPGTANGYHAINFAWLIGETLHRIDGRDVPTFLAEEIAGPLSMDGLFIGTPTSEHQRVAPLIAPPPPPGIDPDADLASFLPKDSVTYHALSPRGNLVTFLNSPVGMSSCIPSISGIFTARSLATLYAALDGGGIVDGVRLLEPDTIATISTVQTDRVDMVIPIPVRWRLGYMSGGPTSVRALGPSSDAYGHVGAGGTIAGTDPSTGLAFGFVYDKWAAAEFLGGPRTQGIVDAATACAGAAL